VTAVFTAHGHLGTPTSFAAGFQPALIGAAGLSLLGAATALAVRNRRPAHAATLVAPSEAATVPAPV